VLPSFMNQDQARDVLVKDIPQIDHLIEEQKFEMMLHHDWYGDGETFDGDAMIEKYTNKIIEMIDLGFSVVRVAGDASGFKPHLWQQIIDYERQGHARIDQIPCIALCCYPIHHLRLQQTKDVLDTHHGVLIAKI